MTRHIIATSACRRQHQRTQKKNEALTDALLCVCCCVRCCCVRMCSPVVAALTLALFLQLKALLLALTLSGAAAFAPAARHAAVGRVAALRAEPEGTFFLLAANVNTQRSTRGTAHASVLVVALARFLQATPKRKTIPVVEFVGSLAAQARPARLG